MVVISMPRVENASFVDELARLRGQYQRVYTYVFLVVFFSVS